MGVNLMAGVQDICDWRLEIVKGWDDATGTPYTFRPSHPGLPHALTSPLFLLFCAFACITLQFSRITIAQREMFQVRFEYCFLFFKPEKSNAFYQRQDG